MYQVTTPARCYSRDIRAQGSGSEVPAYARRKEGDEYITVGPKILLRTASFYTAVRFCNTHSQYVLQHSMYCSSTCAPNVRLWAIVPPQHLPEPRTPLSPPGPCTARLRAPTA